VSIPREPEVVAVSGYPVRLDLSYDPQSELWVELVGEHRARVGLDPLSAETSGTLAQLALVTVGTQVRRGEPLGSIEAEKFVGPLLSPLTGTVAARNDAVLSRPSAVEDNPYAAWLVEIESDAAEDELGGLVTGTEAVSHFAARVERYRREGVLAE